MIRTTERVSALHILLLNKQFHLTSRPRRKMPEFVFTPLHYFSPVIQYDSWYINHVPELLRNTIMHYGV